MLNLFSGFPLSLASPFFGAISRALTLRRGIGKQANHRRQFSTVFCLLLFLWAALLCKASVMSVWCECMDVTVTPREVGGVNSTSESNH